MKLSEHLSLYFNTSKEDSDQIASLFREEELARNDMHTAIGSRYGKLSFIQSGYLRIFKQTDKKEITQWISSPGEFTTELGCLMFDQPSRWNIQAITNCKLYTLDFSNYQRMQSQIPDWPSIERLFIAKCFMTIEDRVFSFISMTSEERYSYLMQTRPELILHVPNQYLASMLGMTPETLSRIKSKSNF